MARLRTLVLSAAVLAAALPLGAQSPLDAAGHWAGTIQIPNHELAVAVDLARNGSGDWIGTVTVPSATDVPLASITVEGAAVRFAASLPDRTSFDGALSADG